MYTVLCAVAAGKTIAHVTITNGYEWLISIGRIINIETWVALVLLYFFPQLCFLFMSSVEYLYPLTCKTKTVLTHKEAAF